MKRKEVEQKENKNKKVHAVKQFSSSHHDRFSGGGITTPDVFSEVVQDLAIVITWVNGSDPLTRKGRKKRCYEHYGRSASHCGTSNWRLDRVREVNVVCLRRCALYCAFVL